jgi:hypothetical protein
VVLDLFTRWLEDEPHARATDPSTSHAADRANRPKRESQAVKLLRAYAEWGAMTDEEAARKAGIVGGWKRCSDLRNAKAIVATGELRQTSMGVQAQVCVITGLGREMLDAPVPQPARLGRANV